MLKTWESLVLLTIKPGWKKLLTKWEKMGNGGIKWE